MSMFTRAVEYIDSHPRIILMMAWPVLCLFIAAGVWINWQGPWMHTEAIEQHRLQINAFITFGILGIMALNMIAQSSSFFGGLGLRLGNVVDARIDMSGAHVDMSNHGKPTGEPERETDQ